MAHKIWAGKISDMRDCNETVKVGITVRKTCEEDHFIISLNFLEKSIKQEKEKNRHANRKHSMYKSFLHSDQHELLFPLIVLLDPPV